MMHFSCIPLVNSSVTVTEFRANVFLQLPKESLRESFKMKQIIQLETFRSVFPNK